MKQCPQCSHTYPSYEGYTDWCDVCNWNVKPVEGVFHETLYDKIIHKLGDKYSKTLYDQILKIDNIQPKLKWTSIVTLFVAAIMLMIWLCFILIDLYLLTDIFNPLVFFVFMFCTLIVITFRPRFSKVPEKYLQPSDAPILFSIIEDLRINLNSSPIDYIVLSTELNASMGYAGWNGKKVLTLGYPLFLILNAQETVEVISHELAHNVNKDPMRGYFQWYASISLQRWYEITYPLQIVSTGGGIFTLLFSVPYNLCLWMVSQVFKWLMILFNWLMWRDSQRAEYYADYLAMTMSGNSCFESIFQKLGYHNELSLAVQKAVLHKLEDRVFQFFLESVGNLPDYEVKRIRQVNMLYESRVDSTHPPTPYRIGFASSRGVIPPGYNLTDYKHRQLLEELQKFETSVIQILCDEYKAVLYQIYD